MGPHGARHIRRSDDEAGGQRAPTSRIRESRCSWLSQLDIGKETANQRAATLTPTGARLRSAPP